MLDTPDLVYTAQVNSCFSLHNLFRSVLEYPVLLTSELDKMVSCSCPTPHCPTFTKIQPHNELYIIPLHITPLHTTSNHSTLYLTTSHYITLHHSTQHHLTSYHIMSYFTSPYLTSPKFICNTSHQLMSPQYLTIHNTLSYITSPHLIMSSHQIIPCLISSPLHQAHFHPV